MSQSISDHQTAVFDIADVLKEISESTGLTVAEFATGKSVKNILLLFLALNLQNVYLVYRARSFVQWGKRTEDHENSSEGCRSLLVLAE